MVVDSYCVDFVATYKNCKNFKRSHNAKLYSEEVVNIFGKNSCREFRMHDLSFSRLHGKAHQLFYRPT